MNTKTSFPDKRLAAAVMLAAAALMAQAPGGGIGTFPPRPAGDPASIARGQTVYKTNCAYCHGEDARGGENGGTNLLREDVIMKDHNGEVLVNSLKEGARAEHKFTFTQDQVADIAAFIHNFRLNSRDPGRMRPPTVLVGDAKTGEAYFKQKCATCHSVTGDLKGVSAKNPDDRDLQQTWLMPQVYGARGPGAQIARSSNAKPVTVTVTQADGKKVDGVLGRIDDFIVTLTEADGTSRSFRRDGDQPKVELHDPMKGHKDLLAVYTDRDIHNITAYLRTIK